MSVKQSSLAYVLSPIKNEIEKQKKEKAERKSKYPFSLTVFLKNWFLRLFYTFFMLMAGYLIIAGCTVLIPVVMGYIIGSLGYNLKTQAELLLSLFSGLFFAAWIFLISFYSLRFSWHKYIKAMKSTMADKSIESK